MNGSEPSSDSLDPSHDDDQGYQQLNWADSYLAERQLRREGLAAHYFVEVREQWLAVLKFLFEHENERLSIKRRIEDPAGGAPRFTPWQATDWDPWATQLWIPAAVLDNLFDCPPSSEKSEPTRIIEQARLQREREKADRRRRGVFMLWEAAQEAADAVGMHPDDLLASLESAARTGELLAYERGVALPIRLAVGARVHARLESSSEHLDAWLKASQGRTNFSFVGRIRELSLGAGGVAEPRIGVHRVSSSARRHHVLSGEIRAAINAAVQLGGDVSRWEVASVWSQLRTLALSSNGSFTGNTAIAGLEYVDSGNDRQWFTRKALASYLRRLKSAPNLES